jgi:predicted ester cyclase
MSVQTNRTVAETARQHFNAGEVEAYLMTLYAPDCVAHFLPPGLPQGHTGLRLFYGAFAAGFPDAQLHFDDVLAEGDDLAVRYHIDATHSGEFNGIPATGKRVSFSGMTILHYKDGKVVERWSESDFLGLLQQVGAIPSLAAT